MDVNVSGASPLDVCTNVCMEKSRRMLAIRVTELRLNGNTSEKHYDAVHNESATNEAPHPSHCGCRLCNTAGVCRSREFWQEAVGTCGLSCQLPRRLDLFAETSIEVGDEILGRTLFYDVTDLLCQIHGLESSK